MKDSISYVNFVYVLEIVFWNSSRFFFFFFPVTLCALQHRLWCRQLGHSAFTSLGKGDSRRQRPVRSILDFWVSKAWAWHKIKGWKEFLEDNHRGRQTETHLGHSGGTLHEACWERKRNICLVFWATCRRVSPSSLPPREPRMSWWGQQGRGQPLPGPGSCEKSRRFPGTQSSMYGPQRSHRPVEAVCLGRTQWWPPRASVQNQWGPGGMKAFPGRLGGAQMCPQCHAQTQAWGACPRPPWPLHLPLSHNIGKCCPLSRTVPTENPIQTQMPVFRTDENIHWDIETIPRDWHRLNASNSLLSLFLDWGIIALQYYVNSAGLPWLLSW